MGRDRTYRGRNVVQPNLKETLETNDAVLVNNRGFTQSVDSAFFLERFLTEADRGRLNGLTVDDMGRLNGAAETFKIASNNLDPAVIAMLSAIPQASQTYFFNPNAEAGGDGRSLASAFNTLEAYQAASMANSLTGSVVLVTFNTENLGTINFSDAVGNTEHLHIYAPFATVNDASLRITGDNADNPYSLTIGNVAGTRTGVMGTGVHLSDKGTLTVLNNFAGVIDNATRQMGAPLNSTMTVNIQYFNDAIINLNTTPPNDEDTIINGWILNIISTRDDINTLFSFTIETKIRLTLATAPATISKNSIFLRGNFLGIDIFQQLRSPYIYDSRTLFPVVPLRDFPRAITGADTSETTLPRMTYNNLLLGVGLINIVSIANPRLGRLTNSADSLTNVVTLPDATVTHQVGTFEGLQFQFELTDAMVTTLFTPSTDVDVTNTPIVLVADLTQYINTFLGRNVVVPNLELYRTYVYNVGA